LVQKTPFYQVNPRERNRVKLILQSLQQYVVIIGNDVFLMNKGLPSGVFGTAWLNCICELLIEILQFYFNLYQRNQSSAGTSSYSLIPRYGNFVSEGFKEVNFFNVVSLINYGDDNLKAISRKYRSVYDHQYIMNFSDWICMGITPARKSEKEIYLKNVTQVLFLKRTPVWNETINGIVGQLEFESIGRMLGYTDSNVPEWESMVITQATRELACHSKPAYDMFCRVFNVNKNQQEMLYEVYSANAVTWGFTDGETILYNIEQIFDAQSTPYQGDQNKVI